MTTLTRPPYLSERDSQRKPRFQLPEELADPTSVRRLEATGVGEGWRCLEVGAGRGSVAHWLANRVGPSGSVEVVSDDLLELELPEESLDLVHARCVLMHVPDRQRALQRMVSWLRPGGWLVVEELDWMAALNDPDADRVALFRAFRDALPSIDFECGRALIGDLSSAGLIDTTADLRVDVIEGATALARWEQLSVQALSDEALSAGTATVDEIDAHLARLEDPNYRGLGFTWVGACGRRDSTAFSVLS
jgi:SAM-dependent methyltransferase